MANLVKRYPNAEFIWCQEEPKNMGAWNTVRIYIERSIAMTKIGQSKVRYVGRKPLHQLRLSNLNKHVAQQREILEKIVGKYN